VEANVLSVEESASNAETVSNVVENAWNVEETVIARTTKERTPHGAYDVKCNTYTPLLNE